MGIRISLLPLASSWVKTEPAGSDGAGPPAGWREHVYLARNPDVAAAVRQGALRSGYEHYVRFGQAEGRTGGFATTAAPPAQPTSPAPAPVTAAAAPETPPPSPPAVVAAMPAAPRTHPQSPPQSPPQPSPPAVVPVAVPPAKPPVPGPAPAASTAPSAVLVSGIRAGAHDGFTRIVLDVSAQPRLERAAQSAPRAVGIEMPNAVWRMARQGRLTTKALGYRVEEGARGASRLTIESPDPIQLKSMFVLPPEGDRGYRVVLDVARAAR
ncbi:hypothetical protein TSO221_30955 [Azospirillum sp. TSO22-1]|nr:hypothetical protein TSO221_30955 [Azospirillum sp. TSO22-1]